MNKPNRHPFIDAPLPQARPMALEQRFMFDAAAASASTDPQHAVDGAANKTTVDTTLASFALAPAVSIPVEARVVDPSLNGGRKEVAFVDTGVTDYQTLVDGIRAGVEVVLLDAGQDGLAQMALWAQSHSGYDAIHVLSHGTQGSIFLGNTELNQTLLSAGQVEHELSSIGTALNVGGDILLYGCDVAQYTAGQTFVKTLAQLTSSDVAASTDSTGSNSLGGDWILEYSTGNVEASSIMVERYQSLLSTPTNGNTDFVAYAGASGNYNQLATGTNNVSFLGVSDLLGWNISAHIPSTSTYLQNASDGLMASEDTNGGAYTSPYIYFYSNGGATKYDYMSFKSNDGKIFDFRNINIDFNDASISIQNFTVAGYLGGTIVTNAQISIQIASDSDPASGFTLFNATTNSTVENAFKGVDEIRVIVGTPSASAAIDQLIFSSINAVNFRTASAVDTTPPSAPSTPDLTVASDTGTSNTDNITSNTTPTFTGTAEAGSTVTLYDTNGTTVLGTATATGGNWSITSSALSSGNHTITAKATDAAGNTSTASTSLSITVDTAAPTAPSAPDMTSASDSGTSSGDNITSNNTPVFTGTAEANSIVKLYDTNGTTLLGTATADGSGNWSITSSTLSEGSHTLTVKATDTAGNTSVASSFLAVTIDRTAPTTTIASKSFSADTGSSNSDFITKTAAQTISGTLSANVASGEIVYVSLDNGATWTAATTSVASNTWSLAGQTLTASNTLKIKVTDAAGNDGAVTSQAYTLDTTAPSAPSAPDMTSASDTGSSNTDNITSNTTPTFTGTAEAGSTVTLYDTDGTTVLGTAVATGGTWSITSSALSSGSHTITAKATDTAGNTSAASASLSITVDTATPTAISLSSSSVSNTAGSNTAVGTLSSTDATVGDSFTYSLVSGAGSTDNASFSISGSSLVATNPSALTAGNYSVRVRTTDVAGNTFEQAFSITVTSNQAPSVTTPTAITLVDTSASDSFSNQTGTLAATDTDGIASYGIQGGTTGGSNNIGGVTYDVSKAGTYGTLYVKSSDGSYVYVPNATTINARKTSTSETFTVTATDNNASPATGTATLTVNITGANDAPTNLALSAATVNQSAGANATVGALSSTDVDTGETFTYTLVTGTGDTDNGSFNISGGNLRATNPANLAAGTYSVRVRTTDASSSTYDKVLSITVVDDVAPTVTSVSVPSNGWYAAGQNLDFTVNLSEAVIVNTTGGTPRIALTVGSTTVYATYVSGSGTSALTFRYTVQASELDTDGIVVGALGLNGGTIQDAAGNNATLTLNSVGSTAAVKVDAVNPSAPSAPDLNIGSDTGASSTDNITSDNTPTLSGTAEANSTVAIYDGTTLLGTATADGTGNWSYTTSTLSNGSHTLTAKATDAAGNDSPLSTSLTITLDAAAPTAVSLSQTSVADTAATNGSTVATLSATDTNTVTYALVSGSGDTNNNSFNIVSGNLQAASNLSAGTYNIRVRATDLAGNTTDQTFTITVTAGPSVASINRAGATALTNATSVDYTVTFSESVTQVDASDFSVTTTGTAGGTISSVTGTGSTYTVTVSGLSGDGTLRLDLKNTGTGIVNGGSQAITGGFTSGQTYTLDTTAPSAPSALDLLASSDSGSSNTDNITSDNTPTISGAGAEPNCTVTLYDTDGTTVLGTTTADGTGAWTITSSILSDGAHNLTTKVTDAAGNTGAASAALTVTIDTTAPGASGTPDLASASDSGSSNTDNTTSVTTPVITGGGAEPGATVTLYDTNGTTVLGTATADGSGNWSITSSTLSSGAHTLTTKMTDPAGNMGVTSAGLTVTIDTTAPSASGTPDLASASDSGSSNTDNTTSVTTPVITGGGAEPGATVTLYDTNGTTVLGTATADGSGNWSIISSTLSSGAHTLTTKVTDQAGNTGVASAGLTVTIDTSAPGASGTPDLASASDSGSSNTDNTTNVTAPTITGGGAEPGATVTLYDTDCLTVLGTTTADGLGNWSVLSSALSDGTHTLTTKVTDSAGNTSIASAGLALTVDTTAPTGMSLSATSVMDVATGINTTVATFSSVDSQAVSYALVAGNGTNDAGNASFVIAGGVLQSRSQLPAGTYNIRVGATDSAGNISYQTFSITVNTNTAPTITSGATASVAENSSVSTVVYTATATDADAGQVLSYSLSGVDAGSLDINASTGVVTLKAPANYEVKNSYNFNVVATDNGTPNRASTRAVTLNVTDVNDASTGSLTITGTMKQGETLRVNDTLADEDGINGKTYQWYADGQPIPGTNQSALTLDQALVGKVISVKASYTDGVGRQEVVSSASAGAVVNVNDATTGEVSISGDSGVGQTLIASNTLADLDGMGPVTYQWQYKDASGQWQNITLTTGALATGERYTVDPQHALQELRVKATYTDGQGTAEVMYSTQSVKAGGLPPVLTTQPAVPVSAPAAAPVVVRSISGVEVKAPVTTFISPSTSNVVPGLSLDAVAVVNASTTPLTEPAVPSRAAVVSLGVTGSTGSNVSGLRAVEALRDVVLDRGEQTSFTLPAGTFVHTDGAARVSLSARLADGRPLPNFVKFNPTTGTFTVEAASGEGAEQLQVVVNAVDDKGQTASTTVVIKLKEKESKSSALDLPIKLGKPTLAEQIRLADKPAGKLADLAALSKAFAASHAERMRA
jgi:Domain of unknown function (DUF4347)/Bacterial Ig-like domain/Cadherin domain